MRRSGVNWVAGVLWTPALILSGALVSHGGPHATQQVPDRPMLERIVQSEWAEPRGYLDIEDEEQRLQRAAEDVAFDMALAEHVRQKRYTLNEREQGLLRRRKDRLLSRLAVEKLTLLLDLSAEEVARIAREKKWTEPIPDRWNVWYIFLEDSGAKTEEEKEAIQKRAEQLKKKVTAENFSCLARLWSDAPSSAKGGFLGLIALEDLGPTFSSHVRQTPAGTVGGPYRTRSGWNILYVQRFEPLKPKRVGEEQMPAAAARLEAALQVGQAKQSPEAWQRLIEDLGVAETPVIAGELMAYGNYLLGRRYILDQARSATPAEEQLREIYRERAEFLVHEPRRKAREILVTSEDWTVERGKEAWLKRRSVRDRAREIRQRILDGEEFASVAREVSAAVSAASGGELGWVQSPSAFIYDRTLSELDVGQISPPVATSSGYLLLQLLDVQLRRPLSFDEASPMCEQIWYSRRRKRIERELRERFNTDFRDVCNRLN